MPRTQKCTICKQAGHNKRRCPTNGGNNIISNTPVTSASAVAAASVDFSMKPYYDMQKQDNYKKQVILQQQHYENKKKRLETPLYGEKGKLFFSQQEECALFIVDYLFEKKNTFITAVGQMGVGKTNLIEALVYNLKTKARGGNPILGSRISIATGMSSRYWTETVSAGVRMRDTEMLNGIEKEPIYHRDKFHYLIEKLQKNPELFSDHIFIFDECHIACDKECTIAKQLDILGINEAIIKRYNLKFINISATPDLIAAEWAASVGAAAHDENGVPYHQFCYLKPGENYRGFKYFKTAGWMQNYKDLMIQENMNEFEEKIETRFQKPKYHLIRVRNPKLRIKLKSLCDKNGWAYGNINQKEKIHKTRGFSNFDKMLASSPEKHTLIFIKEYFRASKRLRLNSNFGLVVEPSAKSPDYVVTAQGLPARPLGYYTDKELIFDGGDPLFICCMPAIDDYIKLVQHGWIIRDAKLKVPSRRVKCNGDPRGNAKSWISAIKIIPQNINIEISSVDYKFEDGYNHPDKVPDNKWHLNTENPNKLPGVKTWFHQDNHGDWCHVSQDKLIFGERAAGGVSTRRLTLCYHQSQPKYMLRWTKQEENSVETNTDS